MIYVYHVVLKHMMGKPNKNVEVNVYTMKKKVNKGDYAEDGIDGIERDFHQIIANCRIYNKPDTDYVRLAGVLEDWGNQLIAAFRSSPDQPLPGARPLRKRSRGASDAGGAEGAKRQR